jgi:hypothetical protein
MNKKTYAQRVQELENEGSAICEASDIAEAELLDGKIKAGSDPWAKALIANLRSSPQASRIRQESKAKARAVISAIYPQYKKNEDNNLHTENAVLLAEHLGSYDDLISSKAILSVHEKLGHIPYAFQQIRDEILIRLEKKLKGTQAVKAQLSEPQLNYLEDRRR